MATARTRLARLALAVTSPVLFLFVFEQGLILFGYGVSTQLATRETVQGREVRLSNPHFTRTFFPPQLRREVLPFSLPVDKPDGVFRIFLLGASAANGVPEPAYGMGRMLETLLQDRYPVLDVEVVNVAITAINSHGVRRIAQQCADLEPDMFVVYLGNNEVVGPYGAGTVFSPLASNLKLIRGDIWLKSTRMGQLLQNLTTKLFGKKDLPEGWGGMEMFLASQVRASDQRMNLVYEHFEANLRDICNIAREARIPVVVSSVGVNLKHSGPFASLHREGLSEADRARFETLYSQARMQIGGGNTADGGASLDTALGLDEEFADAQFLRALTHTTEGNPRAARPHFERALQYDTLRFRADHRINEIIRRVAMGREMEAVYFCDAQSELARASLDGIPGREVFFEHVHLNPHGNYVVALHLALTADRWMAKRHTGTGDPLSEEEVRRRLALTLFDQGELLGQIQSMVSRPPFTGQLDHESQLQFLQEQRARLDELASPERLTQMKTQYDAMMRSNRTHWLQRHHYAQFLLDVVGDAPGAERVWRGLQAELPQFAQARSYLAGALAAQNRYREAQILWEESLALNPYQADAHNNLANCHLQLDPNGRPARQKAIEHYRRSHQLAPSLNALNNLNHVLQEEAIWLAQNDRIQDARVILEGVVQSAPDDPQGHFNLGIVLEQLRDRAGAAREHREVLRLVPDHVPSQKALERLGQ